MRSEKALVWTGPNAPINVKPAGGGGGGRAWGGDLTFFKFPAHGQIIPVKYQKGRTQEISPNKTLQPLFIKVAASLKIHVPVTAAIVRFNHNLCYTA